MVTDFMSPFRDVSSTAWGQEMSSFHNEWTKLNNWTVVYEFYFSSKKERYAIFKSQSSGLDLFSLT